jgi:hypothetical protein
VFIFDPEDSAIMRWETANNGVEQFVADKRLLWPDSLSWGPNGEMYVTVSQIETCSGSTTANPRGPPVQAWDDHRH